MNFVGNRSFLLINPKKPFAEWVNKFDNVKIPEEEITSSNTLYMIDELEDVSDESIRNYLKENYEDIFYHELFSWFTDENIYPEFTFYDENFSKICSRVNNFE